MSARRNNELWTYSESPADPETTLDKVVRNGERELTSLEADGLPEVLGIGSLKYRKHHQPLPYHIHRDAIEVHLCRAGNARFEIEGRAFDVLPGNVCLTQPGVNHHLTTVQKRQEHFWLLLKVKGRNRSFLGLVPRERRALLGRLKAIDRVVLPAAKELEGLFLSVESILSRLPHGPERTLRLRTLILSILLSLVDSSTQRQNKTIPPKLRAVIDNIRHHPESNATVSELAAKAQMSESHFISAFKRVTGLTPSLFRTAQRIEAAKRLLSNGKLRLIDIAMTTGFSSAAYFSTVFRHETGLAPQAWQLGLRGESDRTHQIAEDAGAQPPRSR